MPFPPENVKVCLPFVPYLVDDREEEEDMSIPRWNTIVRSVNVLFRDNTAPHGKSNMTNLLEALKGDWKAEKRSKYTFPEIQLEEDVAESQDHTGMHTNILYVVLMRVKQLWKPEYEVWN